jgi:hypothetical protein
LNTAQIVGVTIGAGVIAAIVIGVTVALILAAIGAKKGYDVWKSHRANMDTAQGNPLYKDGGLSGSNPFYK